jgi:hypothetical protein
MIETDVKMAITSEEIFRLHPKIRWVAFSSDNGEVIFSQMRPGVESYTSNAEDKFFMELGPLFMTSLAERLTPSRKAGGVDSIVVNLGMDSVFLMKVEKGYLALSADRADAVEVFVGVAPVIRNRYVKGSSL